MKHINNYTKTLFYGISGDEINFTLDKFWSDYTNFNRKNSPFNVDKFIWIIKYIYYGNSHLWRLKYSLSFTNMLGFKACRVT